jgi:hypothetical protein
VRAMPSQTKKKLGTGCRNCGNDGRRRACVFSAGTLSYSRGLRLRVMAASGAIPLEAAFYCLKVSCQPDRDPVLIVLEGSTSGVLRGCLCLLPCSFHRAPIDEAVIPPHLPYAPSSGANMPFLLAHLSTRLLSEYHFRQA